MTDHDQKNVHWTAYGALAFKKPLLTVIISVGRKDGRKERKEAVKALLTDQYTC